ncbi:tail fiber domain-containing protein [Dysgonomonas termitidis]|uniref:Tail fiber domain-containing protein n=1 Tax=Dysgonomonas termitidis TaxID=1516126 RepID=A0ABV9KWE5_9BACT
MAIGNGEIKSPSIFYDKSKVLGIEADKQNKLVAGSNITLTDNPNGTTTITSADPELFIVLPTLPPSGQENKFYFIPKTGTTTNGYDEYIWHNTTGWELIGNEVFQVDLTNYYTKGETNTLLGTKVNTTATVNGKSFLIGNIVLDATDIGLENVDNTSDLDKPISTATQTALNAKQTTLVSGTNIKTFNSNSLLGSGNINFTASDVNALPNTTTYAGSSSIGGSANSAVKLATARTIALTGNVTGSGTFDGSGDISIATTVNGGSASSVANNMIVKLNSGTTEGTNQFTFNGSAAKTVNITPTAIGAYTSAQVDTALAAKVNTSTTVNGKALSGNITLSAGDVSAYTKTETDTALSGKQATLVSGTNIKTINSTTLLGSGNIAVQPTLVSGTNIKTINGVTLLGTGDITVSGGGTTTGTLTVQGNGTTIDTFNGSVNKTINITPTNIGAATTAQLANYLPLSGGTLTGNLSMPSYTLTTGYLSVNNTSNFTGAITCAANITGLGFYQSSDKRLKENIKDIDDNLIKKVNDIDFKSFTWVNDSKEDIGVIAQDVQETLPELVNENEDGFLSVNYIKLLILKNISLENEIKELKNVVKSLNRSFSTRNNLFNNSF